MQISRMADFIEWLVFIIENKDKIFHGKIKR